MSDIQIGAVQGVAKTGQITSIVTSSGKTIRGVAAGEIPGGKAVAIQQGNITYIYPNQTSPTYRPKINDIIRSRTTGVVQRTRPFVLIYGIPQQPGAVLEDNQPGGPSLIDYYVWSSFDPDRSILFAEGVPFTDEDGMLVGIDSPTFNLEVLEDDYIVVVRWNPFNDLVGDLTNGLGSVSEILDGVQVDFMFDLFSTHTWNPKSVSEFGIQVNQYGYQNSAWYRYATDTTETGNGSLPSELANKFWLPKMYATQRALLDKSYFPNVINSTPDLIHQKATPYIQAKQTTSTLAQYLQSENWDYRIDSFPRAQTFTNHPNRDTYFYATVANCRKNTSIIEQDSYFYDSQQLTGQPTDLNGFPLYVGWERSIGFEGGFLGLTRPEIEYAVIVEATAHDDIFLVDVPQFRDLTPFDLSDWPELEEIDESGSAIGVVPLWRGQAAWVNPSEFSV